MRTGDTIVALSSGALPSGVAIIRISGPKSGPLLADLAGHLPTPRRLQLRTLRSGAEIVDRGFVAWFPNPRSFTGEDCVELHVHGSRAVVKALLRQLTEHDAVRLAEAGEFTRRAFENGKLDLVEVEGLGDLIAAETEGQRRQALARLDGTLSREVESWRSELVLVRAEIEARLDFADEGDVSDDLPLELSAQIASLKHRMQSLLAGFNGGRIVREGFRVALAGPPNAGKSSLLNVLSRSDVAIVSAEAGTTRDVRELALDLGGQLVVLVDMAGLRETASLAEAEGVLRAQREIDQADLVLWLQAADLPVQLPAETAGPLWIIGTKSDLGAVSGSWLCVSARSGENVDVLKAEIASLAAESRKPGNELLSRERDRAAVEDAVGALSSFRLDAPELAAEALRQASHALERLIGRVDAEMVLDRLFSAFCIGK